LCLRAPRRHLHELMGQRGLPCLAVLLTLVVATPAQALPPKQAEIMVSAARDLLGVNYELGGRLRKAGEGIDCQGVLFYAAERIGRCGWKSYSVMPTQSVARRELGKRVEGLDPVATGALDIALLEPGDIIMLVGFEPNPKEPAIGKLGDRDVWVWHTGLYSGGGRFIEADIPVVVETDLAAYLAEYADFYTGLFVTRMDRGPKPKTCRRHEAMPKPSASPAAGGSSSDGPGSGATAPQ
jgi:cell wall-associated NlpC family hydrolase